tara:strand:- start:2351 stop:3406 length:1056 start_codon:yes stop_codon:yes gene_type:complete
MSQQQEQGGNAPEAAQAPRSVNDFAEMLVEANKIAPEEDEQSIAPQEEEAELKVEANADTDDEEPTSEEDQDEEEEEETEAGADDESEETETSETEPEAASIVADGTYIVDGEEVDGQTLLSGIVATKNFAQEKHKLRNEMEQEREGALAEVDTMRNNHVAGLEMVLGISGNLHQQKFGNVNWMELQQTNPAEYQKLQTEQAQLLQHGRQLQGQLQGILAEKKQQEDAQFAHKAQQSAKILEDKFGGQEAWRERYRQIKTVANDVGYGDDEFNQMIDHRFMDLADRALKAEAELASLKDAGGKKIKNPLKTKRRKNSARVNTTPAKKHKDAIAKAVSSGHVNDWAAALERK